MILNQTAPSGSMLSTIYSSPTDSSKWWRIKLLIWSSKLTKRSMAPWCPLLKRESWVGFHLASILIKCAKLSGPHAPVRMSSSREYKVFRTVLKLCPPMLALAFTNPILLLKPFTTSSKVGKRKTWAKTNTYHQPLRRNLASGYWKIQLSMRPILNLSHKLKSRRFLTSLKWERTWVRKANQWAEWSVNRRPREWKISSSNETNDWL